jgi:hypothetical protein
MRAGRDCVGLSPSSRVMSGARLVAAGAETASTVLPPLLNTASRHSRVACQSSNAHMRAFSENCSTLVTRSVQTRHQFLPNRRSGFQRASAICHGTGVMESPGRRPLAALAGLRGEVLRPNRLPVAASLHGVCADTRSGEAWR